MIGITVAIMFYSLFVLVLFWGFFSVLWQWLHHQQQHYQIAQTAWGSLILSLIIHSYYPSLISCSLDCIQCPHWADVWKALPVWSVHAFEFIRGHRLRVSNYLPRIPYLNSLWDGRQVAVQLLFFWGGFRICSRQHVAFLCSSLLAFSECILLVSIHIVVWPTGIFAWKKPRFVLLNNWRINLP